MSSEALLTAPVAGTEVVPLSWETRSVPHDVADPDACDWWFRAAFDAAAAAPGEEVVLCLDGLATVADVRVNGTLVLESRSMWLRHQVDVGALLRDGANEVVVHVHALAPLLAVPRRPRARWRTRLVDNALRWQRTMLLGRMPGVADGGGVVGPWRPARIERRRGIALARARLRARVNGAGGTVDVALPVRAVGPASLPDTLAVHVSGPTGVVTGTLAVADGIASGAVALPEVTRWWPHTHGTPVRYEVSVALDGEVRVLGHVGFRELAAGRGPDHDLERDGLALHVNGVPIFARGAVWTPVPEDEVRATLVALRDAGMNLVRIPGTGAYETDAFHDACDELGLLVWQDLMFANLDYPIGDPDFAALVDAELTQVLGDVAGRPSFAVLCGNSEVEQQVAMLGLDPALGRGDLFGRIAPQALAASGADAVYVPSAPCGGTLPIRHDRGVANWFGVGGYGRDLDDTRRAGVRFASECLAFANVPADAMVAAAGIDAGVPRDNGAPWDFADVRDRYLELLYGADVRELRRTDPDRYVALSQAVTGEAMEAVFGEWRRTASPCAGGIVLWARDLVPGCGWGVLDSTGRPKPAYHRLRRALAPVAVWTTDEGLSGIRVHVANDGAAPLHGRLEIRLLRDGEQTVGCAVREVEVAPHTVAELDAEDVLGGFCDINHAHRFGPPGHDVVVATLDAADGTRLSQAFAFPLGRPLAREPAARIGMTVGLTDDGTVLEVRAQRLAYGVRIHGAEPADDGFCVAPGDVRRVALRDAGPQVAVTALNMTGRVTA